MTTRGAGSLDRGGFAGHSPGKGCAVLADQSVARPKGLDLVRGLAIAPTGVWLRAVREVAGLSRPALAELAGVHRQTVAYWERKRWLDPESRGVRVIATALGIRLKRTSTRTRAGARHGVLARAVVPDPKSERPRCGAINRDGANCRAKAVKGKTRCRLHGGLSTGPRTPEGRARLAEAMRERWAVRRRGLPDPASAKAFRSK
jgi:transcriptional regulator with XRE-family HTH domain